MITAVDSSVLWAIAKGEADGAAWLETLAKCRVEGRLVVCDIVWAETRVGFPTATAQAGFFEALIEPTWRLRVSLSRPPALNFSRSVGTAGFLISMIAKPSVPAAT